MANRPRSQAIQRRLGFFGYGGRRPGTPEAIENEIVLVGRSFNDAFEEGFGFLGRVTRRFDRLRVYRIYIHPHILKRDSFHLV
jgi:hypothetical protein